MMLDIVPSTTITIALEGKTSTSDFEYRHKYMYPFLLQVYGSWHEIQGLR
jgi:hypothetical protein